MLRSNVAIFGSLAFHVLLACVVLSFVRTPPLQIPIDNIGVLSTDTVSPATKVPIAAMLKAPDAPAEATSSAPVSAGSSGTSAPAPSNAAMNTYLSLVRDQLSAALKVPRVRVTSPLRVLLKLTLIETGDVRDFSITQGSGFDELDQAVLRAVERARPFSKFSSEMAPVHEVTLVLPIEIRGGH
jgi:TonB family protein